MKQYIGEREVLGVEESIGKTPGGNEMVKVLFTEGASEIMPKARFELIVTPEVSDASTVLSKLQARVGAVLFGSLHEYGVKWGEVNGMSDAMVKLCENGMEKASDLLWGCDKPSIPLNAINKILVDNYAKQNSDGVGSEGGGSN